MKEEGSEITDGSPERALWLAVLELATQDLVEVKDFEGQEKPLLERAAYKFHYQPNYGPQKFLGDQWGYWFEAICVLAGVNPEIQRQKAIQFEQEARKQNVRKRKRATRYTDKD